MIGNIPRTRRFINGWGKISTEPHPAFFFLEALFMREMLQTNQKSCHIPTNFNFMLYSTNAMRDNCMFFTAKRGFVDLTSTSRLKEFTNCFVLQKAENESKPSNLNVISWQDNSKVKGESESKLSNVNMISWQNNLVLTQLSCQKHLRHPLV